MSHPLLSRSDDLRRLVDEQYDVRVQDAYLVVDRVPYVNTHRKVAYGALVTVLTLGPDDALGPQADHTVWFTGRNPCSAQGVVLSQLFADSEEKTLTDGVTARHRFSRYPVGAGGYPDYSSKMISYTDMLLSHARAIDPDATATGYDLRADEDPESPFRYADDASARVGIVMASKKLKSSKVAIIGLGGTGGYVLDLIAKTPVVEIHLFDGDQFMQHNAFRAPGAASEENVRHRPLKVDYFRDKYDPMRVGLVAHPYYLTPDRLDELNEMEFVFLAFDGGPSKREVVNHLIARGIDFIDVGMGLNEADGSIGGIVRTTTVTRSANGHASKRVPTAAVDGGDDYATNIQVADLNCLNATLAVIKYKKIRGFYRDYRREHHSVFTIDTNVLDSEERS
ncbi:MAG: ThiF family adenylyltransferase [Acidimicrobiia bacterium]|nr:ThiF family adenylyltransferase [Acidimicrobiia bacterium]